MEPHPPTSTDYSSHSVNEALREIQSLKQEMAYLKSGHAFVIAPRNKPIDPKLLRLARAAKETREVLGMVLTKLKQQGTVFRFQEADISFIERSLEQTAWVENE